MKRMLAICLISIAAATPFVLSLRQSPKDIRHYTDAELVGLACSELSEKHEEVISAHHDASIAHFRRTGAFEKGLGLPEEGELPMIIVLTRAIRESGLTGLDLSKPFFHSASATASKPHSDLYAEFSSLCASNPEMKAAVAALQAAKTFELRRQSASQD